jgi:hypothetical protein
LRPSPPPGVARFGNLKQAVGQFLVRQVPSLLNERDLIRKRTGEGRKRALANGVEFGRKPKLSDYQRKEAIKRLRDTPVITQ